MLTSDHSWPGDEPLHYAAAVLTGATAALVLIHVIPAFCAGTLLELFQHRVGRIVAWLAAAWFSVGAAVSLARMSRAMGSMFVLWRDVGFLGQSRDPWRAISIFLMLACVLISLVIAWQRSQRHGPLIAFALILGVLITLASLGAQAPGMRAKNPHWVSEKGFNDPLNVAEGVLLAAAPASILALRIGRMGVSPARIWQTGLCGVWVPLVTSAVVISLAKMYGARLYWKPSLPVDTSYAYSWMFQLTAAWSLPLSLTVWPLWLLGLSMLGPCVISATWITDLTIACRGWQKLLALAGIAAASYSLMSSLMPPFVVYWHAWLWSIAAGSVLLAGARLLLPIARRLKTQAGRNV
jgi:hypothetical protein